MRVASSWTAGGVGALAGVGLATVTPPALGVVAGAFVALVGLQFVDGLARYGLAGTVYLLVFGLGVVSIGLSGAQTTLLAVFGFGLLSVLRVALDVAVDRGIDTAERLARDRVGSGDGTSELETAVSAGAGIVEVVWTLFGVTRRILWGFVALTAGVVSVVLNAAGVEILVPLVVVDTNLDTVMVVAVGSVLGSFYACGFLADVWHTAQTSVDEGRELRDQLGEQ
jgi:hypothetical protein